MGKKINSELKIENSYFNVKLGTTDKKNPTVVYLDCGCYIEPTDCKDIHENIKNVEYDLKDLINKIFSSRNYHNDNDLIYIFETAEDRLEVGKKSFLSLQLYWKPNNIKKYPKFIDYRNYFEAINVNNKTLDSFKNTFEKNHFNVYKTKR